MWDDIRYDAENYNCVHFLVDAHNHYTAINISDKLLNGGFDNVQNVRNFKRIKAPKPFCIVLFRDKSRAHVGLWFEGRVLHLDKDGVVWQSLTVAQLGFDKVVFYEVAETLG